MKKYLFAGIIVILASCSVENPDAINKEIIRNKNKVNEINKKISQLQSKLDSISGPEQNTDGTVVGIKTIEPASFTHSLFVSGKVEAEEEAWVSPETNGQIRKIHVREGERVEKGQLLVSLGTDITEKTISEIKTNLELQKKLFEKQKELWEQNIGTEVQYLQARTALEGTEARLATLEEQLDMARVRAPFSGIIESIPAREGELAMPGARLLHLVSLKNLKLKASISENYLNSVIPGEKVDVEFPATPGKKYQLKISRIGSVIDNMSRTFEVELKMSNSDEKIKPNQLATMNLIDFASDNALVVPSIILKQDITGYYLYRIIEKENGTVASKLYVKPGRSSEDVTMIEEGLMPGMKVIVTGYNLVKDGTRVQVISE